MYFTSARRLRHLPSAIDSATYPHPTPWLAVIAHITSTVWPATQVSWGSSGKSSMSRPLDLHPPEKIPQGDLTGAEPGAHHGTPAPAVQVKSVGLEEPQVTPMVRRDGSQIVGLAPGMTVFCVYLHLCAEVSL